MSSTPEVTYVLNGLADVAQAVAVEYSLADGSDVAVLRADRDQSGQFDGEGDIDWADAVIKRKQPLEDGVWLVANTETKSPTQTGTGQQQRLETTVQLTIEGLSEREFGHIDPSGEDGVPFENGQDGIVDRVRSYLQSELRPGDVARDRTAYYNLLVTNEDNQSSSWRDFYRYQLDLVFRGREALGE